jgi:S-DNA-T family DNA segregation ATPase FtsK/SpoIIIE
MSSKKNKKSDDSAPLPYIPIPTVNPEARRIIFALLILIISGVALLGFFNAGGLVGQGLKRALTFTFGVLAFTVPLLSLVVAIRLFRQKPIFSNTRLFGGGLLFFVTFVGLADLSVWGAHGGILGVVIAKVFIKLFGLAGGILTLGLGLIISLMLIVNQKPNFKLWWERIKRIIRLLFTTSKESLSRIHLPTVEKSTQEDDEPEEALDLYEADAYTKVSSKQVRTKQTKESTPIEEERGFEPKEPKVKKKVVDSSYVFPPLSLLSRDQGKPNTGDTKMNANIIKRTLQNFGIEVEMDEITVGPTVTRYALKPAEGVKLSRIVALQNDLSLALAAHPLRIEAPIPGKSLVGIEMPNKGKSIIGFGSLLTDEQFANDPKPLLVGLGKNISGKARFANLAKMPHALIAGATGSGKSVTVHALITSLLYRNTPEDLKFLFVDPKRVELTLYNGIPHLLTPVITDAKKTIMSLKWAAKEMDRRYDILEKHKVRDIASYHENIYAKNKKDETIERMPYIVIIIDELADIMQAYPRELESGIVRLAQMSRAVGIHLVLSTQRPSVNVITGLIKANIPARIALQVASQIDSRTIIDQPGAEKLLGAGDMLYSSGEMASPERIQCAYISESEVKKIVQFIKENNDILPDEINLSPSALGNTEGIFSTSIDDAGNDDDLYEDARQTVIESGKASTSYLQRKLGVGYARAAKLIDMLEDRGVVGPGNGAKPREVLEKSASSEAEDVT